MRPLIHWLLFLLQGARIAAAATTYYVAGTGADNNDGLTPATAFRTLQKAADLTNPGDTVLVMDGTYTSSWPGGDALDLKRSGTPDAWITFKAAPGQHPLITSFGEVGIFSNCASYIEISGFTIVGNNAKDSLAYALAHRNREDPLCDNSGISLDGRGQGMKLPNHYRIFDNSVSECGGGGIGACEADDLDIERNHVFDTCWYTRWGTSGISLCVMRDFDQSPGYRCIIRGNVVYNNHTLVPCVQDNTLTDGNGIIIDSNNNTHYTGRTLVVNNLSVHNGGSGIHVFHSARVDIVNNTTWHNSQQVNYGEIFSNGGTDVNIVNNICVAADGKQMNSDWNHNQNVVYDHNLMFGGLPPVVAGEHTIRADPLFVNPTDDPTQGDFHLQPDSPAHRAITVDPSTPPLELLGAPRNFSDTIDLGMYAAP
jgi:hypothetical protein